MDDELARRMEEVDYTWGDKDPAALSVLEGRIADAWRRLSLITYSDLVKDLVFHLPNLRNGAPYRILIHQWTGLDRAIIGSFLGYISLRSYRRAGFMASALAVNRADYKPSEHFFRFMRELEVLPDNDETTILRFGLIRSTKRITGTNLVVVEGRYPPCIHLVLWTVTATRKS